ncbi:hypothetical protein M011DRAFT_33985 [Sporormia fimetaria CBS 119925]|uniref:Peptidase S54 rhomboid domain-containing protein n=1 Tax=Sporormia fimetaria CBS 119925 TaxID=1340428 RepID=A0A6A6VGG1_9PLEO|nr:hypothetical protein M011DRAFT_33985 [Sporormia fimetaria CBS 119925]
MSLLLQRQQFICRSLRNCPFQAWTTPSTPSVSRFFKSNAKFPRPTPPPSKGGNRASRDVPNQVPKGPVKPSPIASPSSKRSTGAPAQQNPSTKSSEYGALLEKRRQECMALHKAAKEKLRAEGARRGIRESKNSARPASSEDSISEDDARIVEGRKNLLRPFFFVVSAVAGVYCICAYLDTRITDLGPRWELVPRYIGPSSHWFSTWADIKAGAEAWWQELDPLTISLISAIMLVHASRRRLFKFWGSLPHIAGGNKYTMFTYTFAHAQWAHVLTSALWLSWFMPTLVRDFDGGYLHTIAFYLSAGALMAFMTHIPLRFAKAGYGIPIELGASSAIMAVVGAWSWFHHKEVSSVPFTVVPVRLTGDTWLVLAMLINVSGFMGVKRPGITRMGRMVAAYGVCRSSLFGSYLTLFQAHIAGLILGRLYAQLDGKGRIWEPLKRHLAEEETQFKMEEKEELKEQTWCEDETQK